RLRWGTQSGAAGGTHHESAYSRIRLLLSTIVGIMARNSWVSREPSTMQDTSPSLLERLRVSPNAEAWRRVVEFYTPLLHAWLRRYRLQQSDADDLVQEVLGTLVRELPTFCYDPKRGAFRSWLRTILAHRLQAFFRVRQAHPLPPGGSDASPH